MELIVLVVEKFWRIVHQLKRTLTESDGRAIRTLALYSERAGFMS